jgi:hypothetical protein
MQPIDVIILMALMFRQTLDILDNHSLNMIIICVFFFCLRLNAVSILVSYTTELILSELYR